MKLDAGLPPGVAKVHAWARAQPWLRRFTLANRLLLAMAFLPTGQVKATGQRFTTIPVSNPIGFFFEAMFQTGPYWRFIGMMQIVAAVLLLVPQTATVGALLFLPIAVSIFLITWGVGFGNTVFVAFGMVLSMTYLLCWDADRIWPAAARVVGRRQEAPLLMDALPVEKAGWLLGGAVGMALLGVTRGFLPRGWTATLFFVGLGAGALVVLGWALGVVRGPSSERGPPTA